MSSELGILTGDVDFDLAEADKLIGDIQHGYEDGNDVGPRLSVTLSDFLELGADCTVFGDEYTNTNDVFNSCVLETSPESCMSSNNNTIWFTDGSDNDLTTILNDVHFNFDDEMLFDDHPQQDILPSTTNISTPDIVEKDPKTQCLQCPYCVKTFQYSSRLQRHLTVHQNKQFRCILCDKVFSRMDVLKTHVARTHKMTSSMTSTAGSSSSSNSSSENDDWIPNQDISNRKTYQVSFDCRFSCSKCPAVLASRHHLERHLRSHQNQIGHFPCHYCSKSFSVKHKYQMHIRHHITDRKFKCQQCGQAFLQAEFLSRHLLTHTEETPFKCSDCGQGFKQQVNLKQHQLRKHPAHESGQAKRHMCNVCKKLFFTSSELKNHSIYHTKTRSFPCTYCGSSFMEKRHLDRHLRRIHSGIQNFFCSKCGRAFYEKFELNYHLRMAQCKQKKPADK